MLILKFLSALLLLAKKRKIIILLICFKAHWNTISKWGTNFVKDHPQYIFVEIQQAFCNHYWKEYIDEHIYMK
jgi:hypothetical protein